MTHQVALTVVAKIRPGEIGALKELLNKVSADVERNEIIPFERLSTVHFARFVILQEAQDLQGSTITPSLIFASSVDAPLDGYLGELVRLVGEGLDRIYSHCEEYPRPGQRTGQSRLAYLRSHMVRSQALYVNTIGRTVPQVLQETQLRDAIGDFLDCEYAKHAWSGWDAPRIRGAIQDFVRSRPDFRWASAPAERPGLWRRLQEKPRFILVSLVLFALLPVFLLSLPIWLLLLRYYEKKDFQDGSFKLSAHPRGQLAIPEDQVAQNQFSAMGYIKPSRFRRTLTRVLLFALDFACRHIYNNGDLGSVRPLGLHGVNTIHFAQWVIIDDGRRLLFMSNYDGSLVSYMDDFINKVAWGLNAVFSNGVAYPKTRWLFLDGARDEQAFKAFLQGHQIPTQVWYTAYKQLTAVNIGNNAQIRRGLYGNLGQGEVLRWLQRF